MLKLGSGVITANSSSCNLSISQERVLKIYFWLTLQLFELFMNLLFYDAILLSCQSCFFYKCSYDLIVLVECVLFYF